MEPKEWPRIQQMETETLLLAAAWKLDGEGRVENGGEIVVCAVAGLVLLGGKVHQGWCALCCPGTASSLQSLGLFVQRPAAFVLPRPRTE